MEVKKVEGLEKVFSAEESAHWLTVSLATIRAWTYQGRLNPIRLGRRVVYSVSELQRFIDAGKK